MSKITVKIESRTIDLKGGASIAEILDTTEHKVKVACNGVGACGLCKIKVIEGNTPPLTQAEEYHLTKEEIDNNIRLGCQMKASENITIELINKATKSIWRNMINWDKRCFNENSKKIQYEIGTNHYGIAIDLGTTSITVAMFNLSNGEFVKGQYCFNPQSIYGSDIVTRIIAGTENNIIARKMQELVLIEIEKVLNKLCILSGKTKKEIRKINIVGNSAMLALLAGKNYELLLKSNHWLEKIDCIPEDYSYWKESWGITEKAQIEMIAPIAGYIGSDFLVGVEATNLVNSKKNSLLIDFGTNSEMGLWSGDKLFATSAAGGPAFEGVGIKNGMQAELGAIYRMSSNNGNISYETIGGDQPKGICGSGFIDLIAILLENNIINELGSFTSKDEKEFIYIKDKYNLSISKKDIDIFQRAKAAIGVGINILLSKANIKAEDLDNIYIAGTFGEFINIDNAQKIGLFPSINQNKIKTCGNTALLGCKDAMLSKKIRENIESIRDKTEVINLGAETDFDEYYLNSLYLSEMGREE